MAAIHAWADHQLDLFNDSPGAQSARRAHRALLAGAADVARLESIKLDAEPGMRDVAADVRACLELLERRDQRWQDVERALAWIDRELSPAAERLLGTHASSVIHPALHALLPMCSSGAYDGHRPLAHPSVLWQRLGDAQAALRSVEAHADWDTQPETLQWHALLSQQAGDGVRLLADCTELCIGHPQHAERLLAGNRTLLARWDRFCEVEPELPLWSFPAWALLMTRLPFECKEQDQRPGARLLRSAQHLLASGGRDLDARRAIQSLCPGLLSIYLGARASAPAGPTL